MPGMFDPLIPQSAIRPMQQSLEGTNWSDSELEAQLRGFGSGALEGLRNLSSPAQLAAIASTFVPAMGIARAAAPVAEATGLMGQAARMAPSAARLPAQFTKAISPMSAQVGVPAEFGPLARASGEIIDGLKAAGDPWQIGRGAEQVAKYLGKLR